MVHYAGYTPRFHPSDFRTYSTDGVGADWPISYEDLKPYYEAIEAGAAGLRPVVAVGGPPSATRYSPAPAGRQRGDLRCAAPMRSASRPGSGRWPSPTAGSGTGPHCIYRGFCLQGCKVNAKASPLITHIPDALAHGAEIRANCHGDPGRWTTNRPGRPA